MNSEQDEHENESHAEMLENVDRGIASILSDEELPGGRFQAVATVLGTKERFEIWITTWKQTDGDWTSYGGVLLKGDAPGKLISLLFNSGMVKPS